MILFDVSFYNDLICTLSVAILQITIKTKSDEKDQILKEGIKYVDFYEVIID